MFGSSTAFGQQQTSAFGQQTQATAGLAAPNAVVANPMKDIEVVSAPDDSVSCLRFSPPAINNTNFLIAGSWDNNVRCW